MTSKFAKFATVIALSAGLAVAGATPSRAGDLDPLFGGLIGGGLGAGVGYAAGKGKGAAIGGILGLGLGAMLALAADQENGRRHPRAVYAPPPPAYAPPPVYTPPPAFAPAPPTYQPGYQPSAYQPAPVPAASPYATAQYSQTHCREYSGTISVDGTARAAYGTACLQPDGTWRIVN
jgi:hypothetical protein